MSCISKGQNCISLIIVNLNYLSNHLDNMLFHVHGNLKIPITEGHAYTMVKSTNNDLHRNKSMCHH